MKYQGQEILYEKNGPIDKLNEIIVRSNDAKRFCWSPAKERALELRPWSKPRYLPVITAQLQSREEGVDPEQQRCVNRGR